MPEYGRGECAVVGFALLTNTFVVAAWLAFALPIGIVGALLVPSWMVLAVHRIERVPTGGRSLPFLGAGLPALVAALVLIVLLTLITTG
ncbi:MAG: hypothetical protein QF719_10425 [Chloroflexota bacterium]|jgi:hypothetical protein|nr:hypothetical protein [Chloroflexota bacterium]MDP6509297.1 hypothetical protein [Chloroflexota bacterium]MDP6758593.1 hypothetical protein [Chloroflexota bacterium]